MTRFGEKRKPRISVGQNDRCRLAESTGRFGFIVRRSFVNGIALSSGGVNCPLDETVTLLKKRRTHRPL